MTVVITGGAGFIGSHLCEFLLPLGHKVICVDNFITGARENISPFLDNPDFRLIEQDITKYISIEEDVDCILHFASPASPIDYLLYPIQTLKVGALGTHNALGLAKDKGARFVLASTSEVYGDPLCNPQPESYWGNVNPIGPRGVYDEAKRFAEAITMAYNRMHHVNTGIARIFNTYGERMRADDGRVVPNFICQALAGEPLTVYGDGKQTRSFCYVKDLINGIWKLANASIPGPVNLGNPNEITILQFAEEVLKLTGSRSELVYRELPVNDPKIRCPDIRLAHKELDWEPRIELEEGLTRTVKYFQARNPKS
jgi:dTDP-glucose 4,6-dehydratase